MKKIIKWISIILCIALICTVFTSCGVKTTDKTSSPDTVTDTGVDENDADNKKTTGYGNEFSLINYNPNNAVQSKYTLAFDDEYIYFQHSGDNPETGKYIAGVARVKYDGTGAERLQAASNESGGSNVAFTKGIVHNGCLYYADGDDIRCFNLTTAETETLISENKILKQGFKITEYSHQSVSINSFILVEEYLLASILVSSGSEYTGYVFVLNLETGNIFKLDSQFRAPSPELNGASYYFTTYGDKIYLVMTADKSYQFNILDYYCTIRETTLEKLREKESGNVESPDDPFFGNMGTVYGKKYNSDYPVIFTPNGLLLMSYKGSSRYKEHDAAYEYYSFDDFNNSTFVNGVKSSIDDTFSKESSRWLLENNLFILDRRNYSSNNECPLKIYRNFDLASAETVGTIKLKNEKVQNVGIYKDTLYFIEYENKNTANIVTVDAQGNMNRISFDCSTLNV